MISSYFLRTRILISQAKCSAHFLFLNSGLWDQLTLSLYNALENIIKHLQEQN